MKKKEFLEPFKAEFWYQARIKFGRSDEMSAFEKYWRPSKIILYISVLCFFAYYHHEILHNLLILVGYIWTSKIAVESIGGIYHRRLRLSKYQKGFREINDFKFGEKLITYFIAASALTGIFAGSMVLIAFLFTGIISVKYVLIGLFSILIVVLYILGKEGIEPAEKNRIQRGQ
jgi:hypothetical protein